MKASASLTRDVIRVMATSESYRRGEDYYRSDLVLQLVRRGNRLYSEVEGSEGEPYEISVTLKPDALPDASCTCPYDWGGACKHIVATLLQFLLDEEEVEEKPSLESLLDGLEMNELRALLIQVAEAHPDTLQEIEAFVLERYPLDE